MTNNNDCKKEKEEFDKLWSVDDEPRLRNFTIDFISQNFIPLSSLKKFIEENEIKDCKCGVFCDCNLETRDARNSLLKLLKDTFLSEHLNK